MRIPYVVWGLLLAPALVGLIFVLKALCSSENVCLADYFAVPVFLPLITIYKIFGSAPAGGGHELLFILSYWGAVGALIGFILDLYTRRSRYLPEQHPPL